MRKIIMIVTLAASWLAVSATLNASIPTPECLTQLHGALSWCGRSQHFPTMLSTQPCRSVSHRTTD